MLGRLEFLKGSVAALAGMSVKQLTDGHDEHAPEEAREIVVRVIGADGSVLAERESVCVFHDSAYYAPELDALRFVNESDDLVVVERVVVCLEVGDVGYVERPLPATLPVLVWPSDSVTVVLPQPLIEIAWT